MNTLPFPMASSLLTRWLGAFLLSTLSLGIAAQTPDPEHVDQASEPALSDSGQWVVWAGGESNPYVKRYDVTTGLTETQLLNTTMTGPDIAVPNQPYPTVNADGSRVALFAGPTGTARREDYVLVVDEVGREVIQVTSTDTYGDSMPFSDVVRLSANGEHVAFISDGEIIQIVGGVRRRETNGLYNAYVVNTSTGDIVLASTNASGQAVDVDAVKALSRDGRYLLFVARDSRLPPGDGSAQIYRKDLTTGELNLVSVDAMGTAVTDRLDTCECTHFSADGQSVLFKTDALTNNTFLWRAGATRSQAMSELSAYRADLDYAADGFWIAASGESFERLRVSSGATESLDHRIGSPQISGDGDVLLFQNTTLPVPAGQVGDWWVVDLSSGVSVEVLPPEWPSANMTAIQTGDNTVQLDWTEATDASGIKEYRVFRNGLPLASTTQRSWVDTFATPGDHEYSVEAVDTLDNISSNGPTANITVRDVDLRISVVEPIIVSDERAVADPALVITVREQITVADNPLLEDINVVLDPGEPIVPGLRFSVSGRGFLPMTLVEAYLESTPVLVGQNNADALGNVTISVTVPANFDLGAHTLVLRGLGPSGSPLVLRLPVSVLAALPAGAGSSATAIPTLPLWSLITLVVLLPLLYRRSQRSPRGFRK